MRLKTLNIFLTFLALFFVVPSYLFAQANNQIPYESVNPDSPIRYTIKRIFEKLEEKEIDIFSANQKVKFMAKLATRRLAEFKYVVDKDKLSYIETSSSRYITQLGLISEELDKNRFDASYVASNLETHVKILEGIKDKFPAQSAQWLLVQQALDTSKSVFSKANDLAK